MSSAVNQTSALSVDGARYRSGRSTWPRLGAGLLRRLWPARCLACSAPGVDDRDLCLDCDAALPWSPSACRHCAIPLPARGGDSAAPSACAVCEYEPPPLAETRAAFVYGAPLTELVPRLKFHRDLAAGRLLGQLMVEAFAGLPRPSALVPVPLHPSRLRQRGYDQALELARPLAQALGIPLVGDALVRVRATTAQSTLDATARQRNLCDAFDVRANAALPAHVVLIDDVMTTGATLHAAAWALRDAGVARVDAWICARAP